MPDASGRTVLVSGATGKNAYELAVELGFQGTEQAYLDSLKGETGPIGKGLTNRGDWLSGTTYNPNDYVFATSSAGSGTSAWLYKGTIPFISITAPRDDTTNWLEALAAPGVPFVPSSRLVSTQYSITGGGDLSADRTLNLVGDVASPGANKVYGTDGAGVRGWLAVGAGSGDFISDVVVSVDSEIVLFSGTTGKHAKRATGTGYAKLTSGVLSAVATIPFTDLSGSATDAQVPDILTLTKISNLTTNGFVKTSAGDGTLSVDTNTYINTILTGKSIWVDATNGNDATGLRGRFDKPFLTITAAVAATGITAGDIIYVSSGTFTPSAQVIIPSGVSLVGSGIDYTIIASTWATVANAAFVPGTNSVIQDLTIQNITNNIAPVGALTTDQVFTNVVFQRVKIIGKNDGIVITSTGTRSFKMYDCVLSTNEDVVVLSAATTTTLDAEFWNCDFNTDGLSTQVTRGIVAGGGLGTVTIRLFNDKITTKNSGSNNISIVTLASGDTVEAHNVRISRDSSGSGVKLDLDSSAGGTIAIDDVTRSDGAALTTNGTITSLINTYTGNIANSAVTLAKIQNAAANSKLVGSGAAGSGAPYSEITLGTNLSMSGTTLNAAGGGGSPGGLTTQVQYNNAGAFGGITNATTDGTTLTVTSPKIVTNIKDTNANTLLGITATASAVNDLTLANSATATLGGTIGAEGTGTNLDIQVTPKGTGNLKLTSGQILVPDGTSSIPGFGFTASSNSGLYQSFGFAPTITSGGFASMLWGNNGSSPYVRVNGPLGWGGGLGNTNDVQLDRDAAGILQINNGTASQWGSLKLGVRDAGTTTVTNGLTIGHQSTGTPAAGLGTAILLRIDSSTTADQDAAKIATAWSDATNISRTSYLDFLLVNSASAIASKMRLYASGGASLNNTTDPGAGIFDFNTGFKIASAAAAGKIPIGDGTKYVASTPTYPNAAPTAGYIIRGDGTNFASYPTTLINSNTADQTGFASDTYITGSNVVVAAGDWKAKGQYHVRFDMTKTAAGVATPILTVRIGTAGSTADTAILTFTLGAGTAAVDTATFDLWVTIRSVGSGTAAVVQGTLTVLHQAASATGITSTADKSLTPFTLTTSSGFASNLATNLGVSFNGGTSFSGTLKAVNAELFQ